MAAKKIRQQTEKKKPKLEVIKSTAKPLGFSYIEDVATMVGCSIRHVHDEIKRGNLKAMKLGKRLRFEEQEVMRWVKKKTV